MFSGFRRLPVSLVFVKKAQRTPMKDPTLQRTIDDEIVVDAYSDEEIRSAWYAHMEEHLKFPFEAECIYTVGQSPLRVGERIQVVAIGEIESCDHGICVKINFGDRRFDVPLAHLKPLKADAETVTAVRCWYQWLADGNEY